MKKIFYLIAFFLVMSACQKDDLTLKDDTSTPAAPQEEQPEVVSGHIRVKLKEGVPAPQVVRTKSGAIATGIEGIDLNNANTKVYRMERVFHGKYEKLLKKEGLDRWYDIYFDETVPTRSAVSAYQDLAEVEKVARVYTSEPIGATPIPEYILPVMKISQMFGLAISNLVTRSDGEKVETYPFNDPDLSKQWHYHNDGTFLAGSTPGADINLFEAWKEETGSPNVIVAVMDGGIQFDHPDLAANMWVNSKEIAGNGIDDDGNGYADDIYGWNFVTQAKAATEQGDTVWSNGAITQYEHGTHCAGTISAVNNNRLGVSGIAGGSGKGDGVRLMSCQIFHMNGDQSTGTTNPNIYIYAADNGAVISQNSWKGGPQSEEGFMNDPLKEAIDYFIKYAGCGEDGQQLPDAPMKGGLVVFAAANDNTDKTAWPAAYDKNLRVAAMGPSYQKAVYSNYGNWIDITAPGGEQNLGETYGILSTSISNGYSWLQGTSMACPHVSGCAALILSKFQGPGFTPDDLRERIMNTVKNIDQYNPKYIGKLGKGYIDVGTALKPATTEKPATPELQLLDSYDNWAILQWTVGVAADGPINTYELYWSESPIVGEENTNILKRTYDVRFNSQGDVIVDTLKDLELGHTYYYTLRGIDRWGNVSDYAGEVSREIIRNQAPQLTAKWEGNVVMDEGDVQKLDFELIEPESQAMNITLTPEIEWVSFSLKDNLLSVVISPDFGNAGKYTTTLTVKDQYGKTVSSVISFQVDSKVVPPVVANPVSNLVFSVLNKPTTIDLNQVFNNPSHGDMIFEVTNTDNTVAWVQRKESSIVITPKKNGTTNVSVRAINENNLATSTSFSVSVQSSSTATENWTTYPDAVSRDLTIALATELQGMTKIRIYNAAGKQVISREVNIGATGYAVDMSSLAKGVYILSVEAQGQKLTKNIVKI